MSSSLVRKVSDDGRKYKNKRQRPNPPARIPRRIRSILPKEHVFERSSMLTLPIYTNSGIGVTSAATAGLGFGMAFEFSLIQALMNVGNGSTTGTASITYQGYSEFQNLFDSYKIHYNKIKVMFTNNNSSINSPSTALPEFVAITDNDDSVPMADIFATLQYQNVQIKQLGQPNDPLKRTVYPKPLVQTYRSAITTGYSNPEKPIWIDMAMSDVPHYGLKLYFNNASNQTTADTKLGKIDIWFTQRFSCKTVR